jgi:hypothetical protein
VDYLRSGGGPFTLQKILVHSALDTTRHYAELSDTDVQTRQKAQELTIVHPKLSSTYCSSMAPPFDS